MNKCQASNEIYVALKPLVELLGCCFRWWQFQEHSTTRLLERIIWLEKTKRTLLRVIFWCELTFFSFSCSLFETAVSRVKVLASEQKNRLTKKRTYCRKTEFSK